MPEALGSTPSLGKEERQSPGLIFLLSDHSHALQFLTSPSDFDHTEDLGIGDRVTWPTKPQMITSSPRYKVLGRVVWPGD